MNFGYIEVYEFYDGFYGGEDVVGNFNFMFIFLVIDSGVGLINYCGYGDVNFCYMGYFIFFNVGQVINVG